MRIWLSRCWFALDVLLNVLLGGMLETMSSRMGRAIRDNRPCGVCRVMCRLLDVFWPDHCIHNIQEPK